MKKFIYLLILIYFTIPALLIAQSKPLLSEAIHQMIDIEGIEKAKIYFKSLDETQRSLYEVDMKGISEISNAYAKEGNMKAAGAVTEIVTPFIQDMLSTQMNSESNKVNNKLKETQHKKEEKQELNKEKELSSQQNKVAEYEGQARNDLERFTGLYGDPVESNENHKLWVMVSCDGYLVSGALWGDASPWWMKSESDNSFTYSDSFSKIRMEFITDKKGKAIKMIHDLSFMKTPLERLGPIPDDWEPCVEQPKR